MRKHIIFFVLLITSVTGQITLAQDPDSQENMQSFINSPTDTVDGAFGLAKGVFIFGLLTVFCHAYPIHSRLPGLIDESVLGTHVQQAALYLADAVQTQFPRAKDLLVKMGIQADDSPPPIVGKLNKEAEKAREKLNSFIDESRKRLESK